MKKEARIIGIHELRVNLTENILDVFENKSELIVTQNGRKKARILPIDAKVDINEKFD